MKIAGAFKDRARRQRPGCSMRRAWAEPMEKRLLLAGELPRLDAGVAIAGTAGPLLVDSPGLSAPCTADWNGDGRKDLIVGQFTSGNIWVFLNQGTDASPSFGTGSKLRLANGQVLTTSYG